MTSHRTGRRPALAAVLAAAAVAALAACGADGAPDPAAGTSAAAATSTEDRLSGELWLNPDGHAAVAARQAREQGRPAEADALAPLADQPTATWFANPGNPYAEVAALSEAAAAAGQVPVVVAYFVPVRDCRSYSAGGAPDADAYLTWVGSLAAALGDRPAVVVLEPDAVAHAVVGCEGVQPEQRYELLARAVEILGRQPEVRTYLDAGNPGWVTDLPVLAAALRSSGVDAAAGFALNVSNFQTTEDSVRFGTQLSRQLEQDAPAGTPPAHFVVDTSRNGAGPPPSDGGADTAWCNPAGRRLGEAPTTDVDRERVDALLWVKQPGDSDGTCAGGPPAGQFWLPAALELAGS
ncbi:glycoside hydrolase family 6 protein [Modestobacter sp. VKM Ac-2986]|uniref:glycoside hydrolase family 6 protein n=1 Tax=Modestobacter sp. VKM Ac-2986 TaxID=3004140 RepID=UPI0022AB62C0|nr:glycoside hydrolase family 6 protein [Modestobacter sp. VKM Ac-2986]MCZ2830167.1 glycoside hydrolase family 6 protein [Modestobacter sp. VKM Ac-2986]